MYICLTKRYRYNTITLISFRKIGHLQKDKTVKNWERSCLPSFAISLFKCVCCCCCCCCGFVLFWYFFIISLFFFIFAWEWYMKMMTGSSSNKRAVCSNVEILLTSKPLVKDYCFWFLYLMFLFAFVEVFYLVFSLQKETEKHLKI